MSRDERRPESAARNGLDRGHRERRLIFKTSDGQQAARWGHAENAVALRETLRDGLASRGRPAQTYVPRSADVGGPGA